MAKRKLKGRELNGLLLLDKPLHVTSNAILQQVKHLYDAQKAGHTGSLDPLASGMLPICFGEATKFSQFLLDANKFYHVVAKLGVTTTTGDAEGEILKTSPIAAITKNDVEKILKQFAGTIKQMPSMFSALKHKGQPLYKLARQGITVERELRDVTIHKINLISMASDTVELEVYCSKGTYIRTLVEDIGAALKCGAHVIALRRLAVDPFKQSQMVTVETLEKLAQEKNITALDNLLLPIEAMLVNLPTIVLTETTTFYLRHGSSVMVPNVPASGLVKLVTNNGKLVGVGEISSEGMVAPKRLCSILK